MEEDSTKPKKDCAGVRGGTAYRDSCKRCVGGTTGKEPCKDTTQSTPCDSLQKAAQNLDSIYIKSKANSMLATIPNLDKISIEKGFPVFQKFSVNPYDVTDTTFTGQYKIEDTIYTGTSTGISYSFYIPPLHTFAADLHTHPPNGYNAPSAKDVYRLLETKSTDKHFEGKFVAAFNGNKYAITVTDNAMAAAFLSTQSQYLNDSTNDWEENSGIGKAFAEVYDHFLDNDSTKRNYAYEMAMAAVLKQYKTGISLNKKDASGNFKPIVVNTITHPEKPKKKFYTRDCL
jgi:hypothetical protein